MVGFEFVIVVGFCLVRIGAWVLVGLMCFLICGCGFDFGVVGGFSGVWVLGLVSLLFLWVVVV